MAEALQIIRTGIHFASVHWRAVCLNVAIPFLLLFCVSFLIRSIESVGWWLQFTVSLFIGLPLCVVVAVRTHRIYLVGSDPSDRLSWGSREWRFTKYIIVISLMSMLLASVVLTGISNLPGVAGNSEIAIAVKQIIIMGVVALCTASIAIVFPAIAVGDDIDLQDAYEYFRKRPLTIFVVAGAFPIIFTVADHLIYKLLATWLADVLSYLAWPLTEVLTVLVVSVLYRELVADS